jgi:hypothetical protein
MIKIFNDADKEGTQEYAAAKELRRLIISTWPDVVDNAAHNIFIIPSAKCYAEKRTDIDILVFGYFAGDYRIPRTNYLQCDFSIRSFCLTIEVKSHSVDGIRFYGNEVKIYRDGKYESASEQSEGQQIALRNYLKREGLKHPYVTNLIWLRYVPQAHLPKLTHNIIGSDATWITFLQKIAERQQTYLIEKKSNVIGTANRDQVKQLMEAAGIFTRELKPSRLDRKKMEEICRRELKEQQYRDKFGEQLLIIRGRGGTGKTVKLLRIAHDLFRDKGARVKILTYNRALVSDISRVLELLNISEDISKPAISIQTIHSFLSRLFKRSKLIPDSAIQRVEMPQESISDSDGEFDDFAKFDSYKAEFLKLIDAVQPQDIEPWDYIFIDEAQDWPEDERDILIKIYGYKNIVVADGIDQLVRKHKRIDWRENIDHKSTQVVTLSKCLRLKSGLCTFTKAIANRLELGEWNVEPNEDIHGGRIIILEGYYSKNRELHDELMERNKRDGNCPVDTLFCVPPDLVKEGHSIVGEIFTNWGYKIWNGVNSDERRYFPRDLEQIRIVQYDSCRGLEGWVVVNMWFDKFYDYKLHQYEPTEEETKGLFFNREKAAHRFAASWLMIPLTRAIDTLVIQVSSDNHKIKKILREVKDECGEIVEWRESYR